MKITNGLNKPVAFNHQAIQREAGQQGPTSIVTCSCDNGDVVTISQHDSGSWDIAMNDDPVAEYAADEGKQAAAYFMRLSQSPAMAT